jgi:predicted ferric reductase
MILAPLVVSWSVHGGSSFAVLAAQSSEVLWYLTRMSAVSAYLVLTLAALLGMLRGVARTAAERLPWTVDELHQVLATIFGGLVLVHLVTLYYHTFIPFALVNFLVPGNQPYRPLAVNLGVLGLYGLVVVLVSSWFRRHISYRLWRRLHYVSFVTFVLVTLHGLLAGSDAGEPWMRAVYFGASAAVGFLVLMRLLTLLRRALATEASAPERERTRLPATGQGHSAGERWQRLEQLQAVRQANQGWTMLRREVAERQKHLYRKE